MISENPSSLWPYWAEKSPKMCVLCTLLKMAILTLFYFSQPSEVTETCDFLKEKSLHCFCQFALVNWSCGRYDIDFNFYLWMMTRLQGSEYWTKLMLDSHNLYQALKTSTRLTQPLPSSHNLYQAHTTSSKLYNLFKAHPFSTSTRPTQPLPG